MKCPTLDELSHYVDDLLTEQQHDKLHAHVKSCDACQRVVTAFRGEQQFIKETLQTPVLHDDFTMLVLDQIEPYEQKIIPGKRKSWKRIMLLVAGIVLALGVSATLNPSFAEWIEGLFSTEQADEGLRRAPDAGLVERINLEVTDKGITLKVEDIVADSSRVAMSFKVLDKNGKAKNPYLDWEDSESGIIVVDQNGTRFDFARMDWREGSDYGLIQFSLREQEVSEKLTVKVNLVELNGVKGNWQLDIPIDLTKSNVLTKFVPLHDVQTSSHGVSIHMKKMQYSPTSNELMYETGFTAEEEIRIEKEIQQHEAQFGKDNIRPEHVYSEFETAIQYRIENKDQQTIYTHDYNSSFIEEERVGDMELYQGTGQRSEQLGQVLWNQSFIPQQEDDKLTFVLDGVFKTVPADFSVAIQPKELKKNPVSFDYEGNVVTIMEVTKNSDYYLRKSIFPIGKRTSLTIAMDRKREAKSSDLGKWILVDNKGNAYITFAYGGGSDSYLEVYGLDKIPKEFTLHLVSVTRYEEFKGKWEVPLYK